MDLLTVGWTEKEIERQRYKDPPPHPPLRPTPRQRAQSPRGETRRDIRDEWLEGGGGRHRE